MKIDKHISDLLYRYDCVIVPELGGFVCNYTPAKIQPVQNSFAPPSKFIVFNTNLRNNDGLLANHISIEERKSFIEATGIIKNFVAETNASLSAGKKVSIDEVGSLFLDVEKNIQFESESSSNFLLESFGFNAFHSPAIKREGITQRIEKEFKDRIIPKEAVTQKRKVNVRRMVALAIITPIIAAMIYIPLQTDLLKKVNFSSLNPFAKKESPTYKPAPKSVTVLTAKDLTDNSADALKENTTGTANIKLSEESPRSIVVDLAVTQPESTSVKSVENVIGVSNGNFFIIGGCFEIPSNATRFVQTLRDKGYNANLVPEKLGRLQPVCYSSFGSREEALNALAKIHGDDPNAWILTK